VSRHRNWRRDRSRCGYPLRSSSSVTRELTCTPPLKLQVWRGR
jgi:hypothetical protein